MCAIDETAVAIIGLNKKKPMHIFPVPMSLCVRTLFASKSVSLWEWIFVYVFRLRVFRLRKKCWTIIVICGKRHLQNAKKTSPKRTKKKHTKADHLHFRWGCQCDVCCNVVIHCDSHTSSLSHSLTWPFYWRNECCCNKKKKKKTGRVLVRTKPTIGERATDREWEREKRKKKLSIWCWCAHVANPMPKSISMCCL